MGDKDRRTDETSPARDTLMRDGARWLLKPIDSDAAGATGLVPALDKALRIIAFLNEPSAQDPALPKIAQVTGVTKSHCHAILKTLVAHGWLVFDGQAKTYRLSPGVLKYVSSVVHNTDDMDVIRPILQRLAQQIEMPILVARPLADGSFIVVDKFMAKHVLEISFPVGYRFPRDACAHMRANLAWRTDREIDAWFREGPAKRYTKDSITDEAAIRKELDQTRVRGYARSAGEFTEGLMAVAQPIFGRDGKPIYIVSCSSLLPIMMAKEQTATEGIKRAIEEVHIGLGGRLPLRLAEETAS